MAGLKKGQTTNTSFVKGKSGNPKGRPRKTKEVRDLFREGTPEAIRLLREMMGDETIDPKLRFLCIKEWLDRDLGKPQQVIALPSPPPGFIPSEQEPAVIILPSNGYEVAIAEEAPKLLEYEEEVELGPDEFQREE